MVLAELKPCNGFIKEILHDISKLERQERTNDSLMRLHPSLFLILFFYNS